MEKLKQRWGLESNFAVFIILIVFALTGSSSLKIARPVLDYIRILIIFPIYQILLLAFGWLFGQFNFFWNIEKKMLKRLGFGFLLK